MEAVITVVGNDKVGILAQVCTACAEANVNVEEVTQRILRGTFAMIMLVDVTTMTCDFAQLKEELEALSKTIGMSIRIQHEDIFNAMHSI